MNDSHDDTAMVCPNCATSYRCDSVKRHSRRTCPNCGEAIKEQDPVPWTNVARVANLAEAGFLTDELVGLGIDARIHQLDDFNALSDRWTSLYLIQVPSENAEEAAAQIQRHRDDDYGTRRRSIGPIAAFKPDHGPALLAARCPYRANGHRELCHWAAAIRAKPGSPIGVQFASIDSEPNRPAICH